MAHSATGAGNVIRAPGGEFRTLSTGCTQLPRTAQYWPDLRHMRSGCHAAAARSLHRQHARERDRGEPEVARPSAEERTRGPS